MANAHIKDCYKWGDYNKTTKDYNDFDYKLNTTICDDGTVCPRNDFAASNDTCCDQHQGITEINYHNEAVIPSVAAHMSDYYSSAGYAIPTDGVYRAPYSTASTATSPSVPAAAAASTTQASLPTSSGAPPPSPGLSSGAKAGIGIGVALGVFLLVGLAAFFWMRRRKPKNETDAQPNHQKMSPSDGSVMYGFPQDLTAPPPPLEVDADPHHLLQRHEMHGHDRGVVEFPEHERRVRELPG
ncbi:MAG: hypothetical protein LQ344_006279 [Seirophora lacunosa]|nr:MAG: hypothetical protein LQ344_006279 [Seirophora lacunosa]